jgi:AAHS family benzoate transporter-like MFS transporter
MPSTSPPDADVRRLRTVAWIVVLATFGLIFDGYDLVVYGAVVSSFLRDPSHIGQVTPATAGLLGSYALVGVMVGAFLAGAVGDRIGRRKVMLISYTWFSLGMAATAMATTTTAFGWLRLATGLASDRCWPPRRRWWPSTRRHSART